MGTKNCPGNNESEGTLSEVIKGYEDFIDGIYIRECCASTPNGDVLNSSCVSDETLDTDVDDNDFSLLQESFEIEEPLAAAVKEVIPSIQEDLEPSSEVVANNNFGPFSEDADPVMSANGQECHSETRPAELGIETETVTHHDLSSFSEFKDPVRNGHTESRPAEPGETVTNHDLGSFSEIRDPVKGDHIQQKLLFESTLSAGVLCENSDPLVNPDQEKLDTRSATMSTWEDITICQLRSSSMLRVPVTVQGKNLKAVVDTAAEVTIISDAVFKELEPKPPYLKKVILHTAGRDMKMDGFVAGPVALQMGTSIFPEAVYVAPIQDDMLLGLDFLLRHGVDIKMDDLCLDFRGSGEKLPMEVERKLTSESKVAKVMVEKTTMIPPNSVLRLQCKISDNLPDYIIEPEGGLDVIVPRTLHSAGSKPKVCLINVTDSFIKVKRNQLVAKAVPVCSVTQVSLEGLGQDDPVSDNKFVFQSGTEDSLESRDRDSGSHSQEENILSGAVQDDITSTDSFGCRADEQQIGGDSPQNKVSGLSKELDITDTAVADFTQGHQILQQDMAAKEGLKCPSASREIPDHLKDLFQRSIQHLNSEEQDQVADLLMEFEDVFAKSEYDLGDFSDIVHNIDTGSSKPIKQRMRRTPVNFAGEEKAHLEKMLDAGVIQPSVSEWASAPVLVRKRDGTVRWCVDYRALNSVTTKDVFPLPLVEDCIDTLAGNKWFSKLDANSAYWQVKLSDQDRKKTAFITKYGLFEHVRMGFGLCNGPATYSRVMNLVLRNLLWVIVLAFLDDILVLGSTFSNHLSHIREVLLRFRKHQLKLKAKKCVLFQREVDFLGRIVSEDGIKLSETDIKAVLDWPVPQSTREVEQFLGLANYHRNFIKDFSRIATPLYRLTGKNPFEWTQQHQQAFQDLKEALTSAPVLGLPNDTDLFILDTDSSNYAVGGELIQIQGGEERVIAYGSYALTPEQINYCTTRKELLAVVRFTRQFRHYLLGKQFVVRTDHSSLRWLLNFKEPDGQLARWLEELNQYDMVVQHRAGKKHGNADSLSRVVYEDQKGTSSGSQSR